MKVTICIFVSKVKRPDLYINILGYNLARLGKDRISDIVLFNIFDFPLDRGNEELRLDQIKKNLIKQANALANNQYLLWDRKRNKFGKEVTFESPENFALYGELADICIEDNIVLHSILHEDLEYHLKLISQSTFGAYIFDTTGLINRHLVDVAFVLSEKKHDFFSFEMRKKIMDYNHLDLIHNLKEHDFRYIKLNNTDYETIKTNNYTDLKPSNKKTLLAKWHKQIGDGKSELGINELREYASRNSDDQLQRNTVHISADWNKIKNDKISGVIDRETLPIEVAKINDRLYDLLNNYFID